ncbi:hypothetical protein ElyMa_000588500 [Elysia marginata]|uniref:Chitin-binding type-2 domain-containing protein n=1 Tax=Elysia marginata TaxID=1093978 RepID=A0AAV4G6T1_9GAST|nr:hypothetical protein ElyMa_000588500 [Elysia marginata]
MKIGCNGGTGTLQTCAATLRFNGNTRQCDLGSNVICAVPVNFKVISETALGTIESVLPHCDTSKSSGTSMTSVTSQSSQTSASSRSSMTSPESVTSGSSMTSARSPSPSSVTSVSSETSQPPFCVVSCVGAPAGFWADCDDCQSYHQ